MKSLNYIFWVAFLFLFAACSKDYLDTISTEDIDSQNAFTTTGNAMIALNGIHRLMYCQWDYQDQSGEGSMNINRDMLGEDLVMTSTGNGWYLTTYRWTSIRSVSSTTPYYAWKFYYTIIANANLIINNIDGAEGSQADRNAIKGEALCYRAWAHFQLVQLFGKRYDSSTDNSQLGVPVMLTQNTSGQARNTVSEVYTQINEDLDSAIVYLDGYERANISHFNLSVAEGIKARVALTMQNWEDAAKYAGAARTSYRLASATSYSLMDTTTYRAGFNDYTNNEWMWGSTVIEDQTTYFYSFFAYMSRNFNSSNIRSNPKAINSALYNNSIFSPTDVRLANFDPTGLHTSLGLASTYKKYKYTSQKFLALSSSDSRGDVSYMRIAEMYLIEAEAYARMGNHDAEALAALNTLREARERNTAKYVASTNTGDALISEILLNRRLELWGEGFRFTDLKRLNLSLDRTGANHTTSVCVTTAVAAGDVKWQWLIPQDEIDANSNIIQNDL